MEVKKGKSLYTIFLIYLIGFCVLTFLLLFSFVLIFKLAVNNNILNPANYVQNKIEKLKEEVDEGKAINENDMPYPSKYIFINSKDKVEKTNFSKEELIEVKENLNRKNSKYKYIYTTVETKSGKWIIQYDIKAHFTTRFWNELIPYPETLIIGAFFSGFIIIAVFIAIKFGKKLKKELYPIQVSTEKIKNQDLDFEILSSNIKEFNEVLNSIEDMKRALKESLQTQWAIEQRKKNQIGALAHDIKTPVTIIKGNAQLLNESEICEDDRELVKYIINNSDKIESYISTLMYISKYDSDLIDLKETIKLETFIEDLITQLDMMCNLKNIKYLTKISYESEYITSNKELLNRAIINIISNAIDYSKKNSEIELIIQEAKGELVFTVKDLGEGFTEEGLKNATNQFYMEQAERKVGKHYGMGLYIAESVAKKNGGYVTLKNRKDKKGAEVSLFIKI